MLQNTPGLYQIYVSPAQHQHRLWSDHESNIQNSNDRTNQTLHTRLNLRLAQLQQLSQYEVSPHTGKDAKFPGCVFGHGFFVAAEDQIGLQIHSKQLQTGGYRYGHITKRRSQVKGTLFRGEQTRLRFGSVKSDKIGVIAIGDCLTCGIQMTDHGLSQKSK